MGSAQRVAVARARAPRDAEVQHCLDTSVLSIRIMIYVNSKLCGCAGAVVMLAL